MAVDKLQPMTSVWDVATSWNGARCAVAAFEGRVAVWDLLSGQKISEFQTVLDFGGRRLAISADGKRVVAGAYRRYGIACYDADTGALQWHRKGLKKVQCVTLPPEGEQVYCGFAERVARVLSICTGNDLEKLRDVYEVTVSPFNDLMLVQRKSDFAVLQTVTAKTVVGRIRARPFGGVAFSPEFLAVFGPDLCCWRNADAAETWRFDCPPSWTLQRSGVGYEQSYVGVEAVGYDSTEKVFEAVVGPFGNNREYNLARFEARTGAILSWSPIPNARHNFCLEGSRLLASTGELIDTRTCEVVRRFDWSKSPG